MTLKEALQLVDALQRHSEWRNLSITNDIAKVKDLLVETIKKLHEAVDTLDRLEEELAHDIDLDPGIAYYGEE